MVNEFESPAKETVYIETSILGYLTARPSRDIIITANIQITREWWNNRSGDFQLYSSQAVMQETAQGDTKITSERLEIFGKLSLLDLNKSVLYLAEQFLKHSNLPTKAVVDAIHIAVATVHGIANIWLMLKSRENWQRSALILDMNYRLFAHPMNF